MKEFDIYFILFKNYLKSHKNSHTNIKIIGNSMLPTMHNGEIYDVRYVDVNEIKVGDIIVYNIWGDHFTVHRVIGINKVGKRFFFKTKGDNNDVIDNYKLCEQQILGVVNP